MSGPHTEAVDRARILEGSVAVVTGGGSGIGRAAATVFAGCGAAVVVGDIDEASAAATVAQIAAAGGQARAVRTDVSVETDVAAMVSVALDTYGHLDIGFNNAGTAPPPGVLSADLATDVWDTSIATNLRSVWLCLKHEVAAMLPTGGGAIVNTASVAGTVGLPGGAVYAAAKHGVVGLTRSAAAEYGPRGIRVNAIAPGMTRTGLTRGFIDGERVAAMVATMPLRRVAEPAEIAEAVLWLVSPLAGFVTGHVLAVDGGETAT